MEAVGRPADGDRSPERAALERLPMPRSGLKRSSRKSTSVGPAEGTDGASEAPDAGDKETPSFPDVIGHVLRCFPCHFVATALFCKKEHRCPHSSKKAFAHTLLRLVLFGVAHSFLCWRLAPSIFHTLRISAAFLQGVTINKSPGFCLPRSS